MKKEQKTTLIFAHRGASGEYPENTLLAFQKAAEQGADGLEFDVQLTKDQVPVVIHDEKLEPNHRRYRLGAGSYFGGIEEVGCRELERPFLPRGKIPTLEEVLAWANEHVIKLNIELKTGLKPYPGLVAIVAGSGGSISIWKNRVILSSFNHYSLVEVRDNCIPDIETAILFMEGLYQPWEYAKRVGAKGLHCFLPVAQAELLMGAAQAGMPVRPFTVNESRVT